VPLFATGPRHERRHHDPKFQTRPAVRAPARRQIQIRSRDRKLGQQPIAIRLADESARSTVSFVKQARTLGATLSAEMLEFGPAIIFLGGVRQHLDDDARVEEGVKDIVLRNSACRNR